MKKPLLFLFSALLALVVSWNAAAATKIGDLPTMSALAGTELLTGVQSGANKNATPALISTYLATNLTFANTGLKALDTDSSHSLVFKPGSNLTAARTLTVTTGDNNRTLDISAGDVTVSSFGASLVDDASAQAAMATLKGVYVLCASAATGMTVTGTTTETTLATCTVPANAMGANGILRITSVWTVSSSANTKTARVRFPGTSGTFYQTLAATTNISLRAQAQIANRNSASSQIGMGASTSQTGWTSTTMAHATSTADTTTAQDIVFRGLLANTGDTITLESYLVELVVP